MSIYKNRISKLSSNLKDNAFLITNDKNIYYFTGLWDSNGYLLVTEKGAFLIVDFRYGEVAEKTVTSAKVIVFENLFESLNMLLKNNNIKNCFLESSYVTVSKYHLFSEKLNVQVLADSTLDDLINSFRIVKDESEIQFLTKAQQITEEALKKVMPIVKVGTTEREIANLLEFEMKRLGAEEKSFDLISITGKKTSLPHGVPGEDVICDGDFVTFDIGATYRGYHSDMTRTYAVGFATDEMKMVYNTVLAAHNLAIKNVRAGVKCSDIDKIARNYIYQNGYKGCFGHATGHGVGLDIHEYPTVSERCDTVLKEGMIITIEPGIYIQNKFGVRIEDTVVVTPNGYKSFATLPKELIIL